MPLPAPFMDTTSERCTDYEIEITKKKQIMAKAKEGKERKNNKKEAVKSLKEKRADKVAKKAGKNGVGTI